MIFFLLHFLTHSMKNTATSSAHTTGPCVLCLKPQIEEVICDDCYNNAGEILSENAVLFAAAREMRTASQELYDRLQEYLDFSDDELIEQGHEVLVEAMDAMEAAWHKADGRNGGPHQKASN